MNEQFERIKEKLNKLVEIDKKQEVFGANYGGYGHKYNFNAPLNPQITKEFENQIVEYLPEDYLMFLTQFCNGDTGPYYGLFNFEEAIKTAKDYYYDSDDENYDENNLPNNEKCFSDFPITTKEVQKYINDSENFETNNIVGFYPKCLSGVLFLSHYGCGHHYVLVVKGEQKGTVWFLADYRELSPLYFYDSLKQFTFFDWYENWLDVSLQQFSKEKNKPYEPNVETEKVLVYDSNNLKAIPSIVFKCKNLKKLVYSRNKLDKIPEELFNLENLKILDLNMNGLKEISPNIKKLKNLIYLNVGYNYDLKEIPEEVSQLTNLKEISAAYASKLQSIPMMIGNLINLKTLNFFASNLSSIPETIGNLINLEYLSLSDNKELKYLPESLGNLKSLKWLHLSYTAIKKLPDSFINLMNLEGINLEITNDFDYDDAFKKLSKLPKLNYLKISNQLKYPDSIGMLTNLKTLEISHNYSIKDEKAKFVFPESFNQLTLEELVVEPRNFVYPKDLGNLKYVRKLRISDEALKYFKPHLKEFTNLKELSFSWVIDEKEKTELKQMLPKVWIY